MEEEEKYRTMPQTPKIADDHEYRITRDAADRCRKAIDDLAAAPPHPGVHPLLAQAEREALQYQLDTLLAELAEYERRTT